jgi:hypothetical protein
MSVKLDLSHYGKTIYRVGIFENRILRIFGPIREEVARSWRKLHEDLYNIECTVLLH